MSWRQRHSFDADSVQTRSYRDRMFEQWVRVRTARCLTCGEKWAARSFVSGDACDDRGEPLPDVAVWIERHLTQAWERTEARKTCFPNPRVRRVVRTLQRWAAAAEYWWWKVRHPVLAREVDA